MASESPEPIERWTAKRRVALVVSILKGETSVAEAARTHGLTVAEVDDWREKLLLGAENALRSRARDEEVGKDEQIRSSNRRSGLSSSTTIFYGRRCAASSDRSWWGTNYANDADGQRTIRMA